MDSDQNWYRQLAALVLLSASRAAVEFITNPGSREDATKQLKGAFADIDYEALANQLTRQIENVADASKGKLAGTIDTLKETSVEAVEQAKTKAQKQSGQKRKGKKMRFLIGLIFGGAIAYFLLDEQRRDDLLDKLTGASGPIQQAAPSFSQPVTPSPPPAPVQSIDNKSGASAEKASDPAKEA